jgi:hypothetical protein
VDNTDALKVGAAVVGGYLLGRTKKARTVASLALWATGNRYRVRDVARDGVVRLAQSPEVSKTTSELTGPLLEASRRAALAVVQAQAQRLTQDLQNRTSALTDVGESLLQPDAQGDADEQPEDEPDERAAASADETDEDEGAEEESESPRRTRSTARSAPAATRRRTEGGSTGTGARRTRSSGSGQSGSRTSSSRGSGSSSRRSTTSTQKRSASSRQSR